MEGGGRGDHTRRCAGGVEVVRGVAADGDGGLPRSEESIATAAVDAMVGRSLDFLELCRVCLGSRV